MGYKEEIFTGDEQRRRVSCLWTRPRRRDVVSIPPGQQVKEGIQLAAPGFPIFRIGGARNPEVELGKRFAGIPAVPEQT